MSIEIKGLDKVIKNLETLRSLNTKTKPLMKSIGNILSNEIKRSFESETSPFGERWKPLSANTAFKSHGKSAFIKSRKRHTKSFLNKFGAGGRRKILREEGDLADRWVVDATNDKVTVSNNIQKNGFKYGLTHQFGTNNAFGKGIFIPARPFLPIDKNRELPRHTKKIIEETVADFVVNKLK